MLFILRITDRIADGSAMIVSGIAWESAMMNVDAAYTAAAKVKPSARPRWENQARNDTNACNAKPGNDCALVAPVLDVSPRC
jgi:hypothetical protein